MSPCASPWFAGLTRDHLYADCPNRMRDDDEPRPGEVDPHGTDICGMCVHRHNRREHPESA